MNSLADAYDGDERRAAGSIERVRLGFARGRGMERRMYEGDKTGTHIYDFSFAYCRACMSTKTYMSFSYVSINSTLVNRN